MAKPLKIALVVIATGKYLAFIPSLWQSAQKHFLSEHDVHLYLLTDGHLHGLSNAQQFHILHEAWPGPTLHRYHSLRSLWTELLTADYCFMCDADMRFVGMVGDELLAPLTATIHPGYANQYSDACPFDRNPQSRAFVSVGGGGHYYAGGFQGGETRRYLAAVDELANRITSDEQQGVVATWHDESHWNRYLIDHPPSVALSPSYCFPEGWILPYRPLLLALDKDHATMRSQQ